MGKHKLAQTGRSKCQRESERNATTCGIPRVNHETRVWSVWSVCPHGRKQLGRKLSLPREQVVEWEGRWGVRGRHTLSPNNREGHRSGLHVASSLVSRGVQLTREPRSDSPRVQHKRYSSNSK
ncbi:unnamed protein product [Protopolystoma xenopodis]|uniref:Uncharacterized protein n=1 Tax=Protopolystoma xenopodis TaxID=117903 RepID=A0A3S5CMX9_9PLAT|nr:unnamed protein product [Protopolystoma xenopodis]